MLKHYLIKSKNIKSFSKNYINYLHNIFNSLDLKKLSSLEKEFLKIRASNSTLFSIGNGGAAATSMTLANDVGFDILKKTKKKGFKIVNLCDNNSIITAIANDVGYDRVFIEQLKLHYKKNDALIIFSASRDNQVTEFSSATNSLGGMICVMNPVSSLLNASGLNPVDSSDVLPKLEFELVIDISPPLSVKK